MWFKLLREFVLVFLYVFMYSRVWCWAQAIYLIDYGYITPKNVALYKCLFENIFFALYVIGGYNKALLHKNWFTFNIRYNSSSFLDMICISSKSKLTKRKTFFGHVTDILFYSLTLLRFSKPSCSSWYLELNSHTPMWGPATSLTHHFSSSLEVYELWHHTFQVLFHEFWHESITMLTT